jgi:hypothetical protein
LLGFQATAIRIKKASSANDKFRQMKAQATQRPNEWQDQFDMNKDGHPVPVFQKLAPFDSASLAF